LTTICGRNGGAFVDHAERPVKFVGNPLLGGAACSTNTAPPSPRSLGSNTAATPSLMKNGVRENLARPDGGGALVVRGAFAVRGTRFVETTSAGAGAAFVAGGR
jgi:hypothetical protein